MPYASVALFMEIFHSHRSIFKACKDVLMSSKVFIHDSQFQPSTNMVFCGGKCSFVSISPLVVRNNAELDCNVVDVSD